MKNPIPSQSVLLARSIRRDMMVGTAVLLLVETGLGGMAAASASLATDPSEPEADAAADTAAKKHRPVGAGSRVPDIHVDTAGNAAPLSADWHEAGGPAVDFTLLGSTNHRPSRHLLATDLSSDDGKDGHGGHAGGPRFGAGGAPQSHQAPFVAPGTGDTSQGKPTDADGKPADWPTFERPVMHVLVGTDGNDVIRGGDDNDYIFGRDGDDVLEGGKGSDRLLGGKGDDVLVGGAGLDMLVGDAGNDVMTGGAGADSFLFRTGFGHDTVTDFRAGGEHDVIAIAKSDFADFAALSAHLIDTAAGALLTLHDGSTLTLNDVTRASLGAHDFYFGV